MAGDWSAPELADLLTPFAERMAALVPPPLQVLRRWVDARAAEHRTQHRRRRAGEHPPPLRPVQRPVRAVPGRDDDVLVGLVRDAHTDLAAAQRHKIDAVLDLAGVRGGTELLEIGTGWGELALRAARRGAFVTSLTISPEQRDLAERRIADAGLVDRVRVLLQDYRQAAGRYDAVVSVEMIEAVGQRVLARLLRRHRPARWRRAAGSGCRRSPCRTTGCWPRCDSYTWIHKYIFPGGQVLSVPGDRARRRAGTPDCASTSAASWATTTRRRCGCGGSGSRRAVARRSPNSASTRRFAGCGSSTWPIPRPDSAAHYLDVWQFGLAKPL